MWKSVGKACKLKHPRAPSIRLLFQDDRATPAVPTFLRETGAGEMINLASPAEEGGGMEEEREEDEEEDGTGPP